MSVVVTFESVAEASPGERWAGIFARHWPRYREWFLSEGEAARPSYAVAQAALERHMPELVPTFERLCGLAGGGDLEARFLSMWHPPSYLSGCSQAVWRSSEDGMSPALVRNYDYAPERLEGTILMTRWNGRSVIGTGDCAWGLLDGLNDAGLAVSLAFGGRRVVGEGFGVPLVVRYLLETCPTTDDARAALQRLPYHLAHTLTIVDRTGDTCTAYLSPDRGATLSDIPIATNHQGRVEWAEHAEATFSIEREGALVRLVSGAAQPLDQVVDAFLHPPLRQGAYERGMGTLYTAVLEPAAGRVRYLWPSGTLEQGFSAFVEESRVVTLAVPSAA